MRTVVLVIFGILAVKAFAFTKPNSIFIKKTVVQCKLENLCEKFRNKYKNFNGQYLTFNDLKNRIKWSLLDGSIEKFSYSIFQNEKEENILYISLTQKKIISDISISSNQDIDFDTILKKIPYQEDNFYEQKLMKESLSMISQFLLEKGFGKVKVGIEKTESENKVNLNFKVSIGELITIGEFKILGGSKEIRKIVFKDFFQNQIGRPYNKSKFKFDVDKISKSLFDKGYFGARVEILPLIQKRESSVVTLRVKLRPGVKSKFYFRGNHIFDYRFLLRHLKEAVKNNIKVLSPLSIKTEIISLYEKKGIYKTGIKIRTRNGQDKNGEKFKNFFVEIEEGNKIKVIELSFSGQNKISMGELSSHYWDKASDLASNGYLDYSFLSKFKTLLEEKYLKRGHVFIEVLGPNLDFDEESKKVKVSYSIDEGIDCKIEKIRFGNVPKEVKLKILDNLKNKVSGPLNVMELKRDLIRVLDTAKNEGYLFSEITNIKDPGLITYSEDFRRSSINIKLRLKKKAFLEKVIVNGNIKTKLSIINREINLKKGEVLTPKKLKNLKDVLGSLGLFSAIKIDPYINNNDPKVKSYRIDLIINLKEKDYTTLTLAPGYRTDLGMKLSTELRYQNLRGKNRLWSTKLQTNYRLDSASINTERYNQFGRLLEVSLRSNYVDPFLFNRDIEFDLGADGSIRRKFSFDAYRVESFAKLSKTFWDHFTTGIQYRLEFINQRNVLYKDKERLEKSIRIGSFSPSFSLDFRDKKVNPTSGFLFSINWEFANPSLFSSNSDKIQVNYHKLVGRSFLYLPVTDFLVGALSLGVGYQKNLASRNNPIPSLKVFNLSGIDNLRGYGEKEINNVEIPNEDGYIERVNINDISIYSRAFFFNFKLEPRYYYSDRLIFALFFDMGGVYRAKFEPRKARTSLGLGIKVLTPVGSLDFDYGIKLKRRSKEGFGKFHLSIGFF